MSPGWGKICPFLLLTLLTLPHPYDTRTTGSPDDSTQPTRDCLAETGAPPPSYRTPALSDSSVPDVQGDDTYGAPAPPAPYCDPGIYPVVDYPQEPRDRYTKDSTGIADYDAATRIVVEDYWSDCCDCVGYVVYSLPTSGSPSNLALYYESDAAPSIPVDGSVDGYDSTLSDTDQGALSYQVGPTPQIDEAGWSLRHTQ